MGNIGTFGEISFYVKSAKGKGKALGLSDLSRSASVKYEEHERNGKKALLEYIAPELEELSFSVYADANLGVKPSDIQTKLHKYMLSGTPDYFILGGNKIGDNRWVITNLSDKYKVFYRDGRPVSISFEVTLKEYANSVGKSSAKKKNNTKTTAAKTAGNSKTTGASSTKSGKSKSSKTVQSKGYTVYTVAAGDTLWSISKKFYGKGNSYSKIYNANKTKTDGFTQLTSPNKIAAGYVIKIPK